MSRTAAQAGAVGSLLALIALCLAWELWLAPARVGGSWLVLKTLPLLAPLFGLLHGRRRTFQWTAFLAFAEIGLALALFACAIAGARALRQG
jgi:uncharacterized membrane protein